MIKIAPSNSLYIIRPFLYYFEEKLSESIAKFKNITINEKVKLTILDLVANKIFNFFSKILVIELDIKKNNNELIGNNSDEKFEYFISNYY